MFRFARRVPWLFFSLLAVCLPLVASAQDRGGDCTLLSAGNDFYTIYIRDYGDTGTSARTTSCVAGPYGVVTGPEHPAGAGLDILHDGANPLTSFNTVHSYTTGADYVISNSAFLADRALSTYYVGSYSNAEIIDDNVLRLTLTLPGPKLTPDSFTIILEIEVFGATFEDSTVRVETTVFNPTPDQQGGQPVTVGFRHLWDFALQGPELDTGPVLTHYPQLQDYTAEASFSGSDLPELYQMSANDTPADYWAIGSGTERDFVPDAARGGTLTGVPPTRVDYVCWPAAASTPFDYTTQGLTVASEDTDCSAETRGDSAVAYYWTGGGATGLQRGAGITIQPGESYTVDSWLFTQGIFFGEEQPDLCLSLQLDATQVSGNLGINNLQNNDVVCGEDVLDAVAGAARGDEDDFKLFFDGSDVGITRTIIDGMDILEPLILTTAERGREDAHDILLSFNIAHSIPPLGLVLQSDIIRFVADQNGNQTQGHFERFFDGSDIGLTAPGENIDAFVFDEQIIFQGDRGVPVVSGNLFFSTSGNGRAQGVTWRDEDIVACFGYSFTPGNGGDINSSCEALELFFDGSMAGLDAASEDVDAFALVDREYMVTTERGARDFGDLYLSTRGNFSINDVSGRNEDVFVCQPAFAQEWAERTVSGLPITSCNYVQIVFDGSDYGLGPNNVFSIDILTPLLCPTGQRGTCE